MAETYPTPYNVRLNIEPLAELLDEALSFYYRMRGVITCRPTLIYTEEGIQLATTCFTQYALPNPQRNDCMACLLFIHLSNVQYQLAEVYARQLIQEEQLSGYATLQLADFLIKTRRYDVAIACIERALTENKDDWEKQQLENLLQDGNARKLGKEAGGKSAYLPMRPKREAYFAFMEEIGVSLTIPSTRPPKIAKVDYPPMVEKTDSNFNSFVAFDVETTGINHNKDNIIELSAIRVVNGEVVATEEFCFNELIRPHERRISREVEAIHGIGNEMVQDARRIWDVFPDFAKFIGDDILVGYNCKAFDCKFLRRAGRHSGVILTNEYFDVLKYARKLKSKLNLQDKMTLTALGEYFSIDNEQAHRALSDAIVTAKVFLKLQAMEREYQI